MFEVPALLWMLVTFVVEVQRDFGIQTDSEIIIHHTFLRVQIPETQRGTSPSAFALNVIG